MDSEDEDYQMQIALALSMQDVVDGAPEGQAPQQAATSAAAAPLPAPAPAAAGAGAPDIAAALAAALQAIASQQPAGEVAPPPGFTYEPAAEQRRQQPAARSPAAPPRLPAWAQQLGDWWRPGGSAAAGASAEVQQLLQQQQAPLPLDELPPALAAMGDVLGHPVACLATSKEPPKPGSLILSCLAPSGSASVTVRASDLDATLANWLARSAGAPGGAPGRLPRLAAAFSRVPAPGALPRGAAQVLLLLGLRLAARGARGLEDDEGGDLFFDTGRSTVELMEALRSPSSPLPPAFLSAMVLCCSSEAAAKAWAGVLRAAVQTFGAYKLTGGVAELEPLVAGLDRVTQDTALLQQMAATLCQEALTAAQAARGPHQAASRAAQQLARNGLLAPLLCVSSAVDALAVLRGMRGFFSPGGGGDDGGGWGGAGAGVQAVSATAAASSPATGLFTCLRSYPDNAGEVEGARRLLEAILGRVADVAHQVAKRLAALKAPNLPAGAGREALLSWLAAVAWVNEVRCRGGEYSALQHLEGAPDGYMLNLTAAVLRLAKPFVSGYLSQSPKFSDLFAKHLSPAYYQTHARRLGSAASEPTLSGQRGLSGAAGAAAQQQQPQQQQQQQQQQQLLAEDPAAASGAASFVAEVFFLAQRYLHVGLMPAVHRFSKLYQHLWDSYSSSVAEAAAEAGVAPPRGQRPPPEINLVYDCSTAQLLQPDATADAVQFAVLEIVWLADLLTSSKQQQQQQNIIGSSNGGGSGGDDGGVLALVPESVLADAVSWLTFVIQQGQAEQLAAAPIGLLMQSLVVLLEHPSEVRSLLVVSKVVQLLLVMLSPQVDLVKRTRGTLGPSNLSPGEMALVASVLGTSATQQQLVPALMRVYGQADFVVGLDVDTDNYDKFTMRHQIDQVLQELWQDDRCRACIRAHAAAAAPPAAAGPPGGRGVFGGFVSGVLNDLMYLFKDSLERLADMKQIEDSRADAKAWAALPEPARRDKEAFYRGQRRTAAGFMSLAVTTLDVLNTLTSEPDIGRAFMVPPLLGRTAYAVLHFLDLLVGPRCQSLQVKDPHSVNFDRQGLLLSMARLAGRLARHPEFAPALAEEPEYEERVLAAAAGLLNEAHAYAEADALSSLAAAVAGTPAQQSKKRPRRGGEGGPEPMDAEGGPSSPGGAAAAAAGSDASVDVLLRRWSAAVGAAGAAPAPASFEEAEPQYVEALGPLALGSFDASQPGAYNSQFHAMAAQPEGDASQKLRRLGRELRDLRGKTRLPVQAAASCFVRQDHERPDKVRCVISGPLDTPYEGGLFVFDVFFPPGYPNVPPLMVLETTGEGRARFNPNLYADGKVCLSLLGTWHGGDEASKWNPSTSSLFQILLSIQGMIFVEDPYFNEPNVELMRGTTEGNATSSRYNVELRLSTLRWAVLGLLRRPPPGLEDLVRAHFRVLRGALVARSARWLREAAAADGSGTLYRRMADLTDEVVDALAAL